MEVTVDVRYNTKVGHDARSGENNHLLIGGKKHHVINVRAQKNKNKKTKSQLSDII